MGPTGERKMLKDPRSVFNKYAHTSVLLGPPLNVIG